MTTVQTPDDLVYLECQHYSDSVQPGVVFVDGQLVDPIPRWRAETLCLQMVNTRIVEVAERFARDAALQPAVEAQPEPVAEPAVEPAVEAPAGDDGAVPARRRKGATP